jgi:diketogulonate reductase-like aldo/keto reductase
VSGVLPPIAHRLRQESGQPVTPGQVLLGWIWKKGGIAVTTSSKKERMEEYIKAQLLPELTEAEVTEIDRAGVELHSRQFVGLPSLFTIIILN